MGKGKGGGVGVGGDLLVIGTGSGDVVAMNQSDGSLAWKVRASSEVLAPPQVDRDIVVVQTIDGKVTGYDALSGDQRWVYTMNTPALTLRGTAAPIIFGDIVITAFANGRVAFLDRERVRLAYECLKIRPTERARSPGLRLAKCCHSKQRYDNSKH